MTVTDERAEWDAAYINNLPDSAFAYIEPGGKKDEGGKTVPRSLRHFPLRNAQGKLDAAHVRNAMARASQSPFMEQAMPKIKAAAKELGIGMMADSGKGMNDDGGPDLYETREVTYPFELRSDTEDDGLTLEGYAAVFNRSTQIEDWDGKYEETIAPGAFNRTIRAKTPVLMFNHGRHPLLGPMPLGKIDELREDSHGLFIRAALFDNYLIWPVRDAIAAGAIDGMSFRFDVIRDDWTINPDRSRSRTLKEVKVPELGPVVFPAYQDAKVIVRSMDEYMETGLWAPSYLEARSDEPDDVEEDEDEVREEEPVQVDTSETAPSTSEEPAPVSTPTEPAASETTRTDPALPPTDPVDYSQQSRSERLRRIRQVTLSNAHINRRI